MYQATGVEGREARYYEGACPFLPEASPRTRYLAKKSQFYSISNCDSRRADPAKRFDTDGAGRGMRFSWRSYLPQASFTATVWDLVSFHRPLSIPLAYLQKNSSWPTSTSLFGRSTGTIVTSEGGEREVHERSLARRGTSRAIWLRWRHCGCQQSSR